MSRKCIFLRGPEKQNRMGTDKHKIRVPCKHRINIKRKHVCSKIKCTQIWARNFMFSYTQMCVSDPNGFSCDIRVEAIWTIFFKFNNLQILFQFRMDQFVFLRFTSYIKLEWFFYCNFTARAYTHMLIVSISNSKQP